MREPIRGCGGRKRPSRAQQQAQGQATLAGPARSSRGQRERPAAPRRVEPATTKRTAPTAPPASGRKTRPAAAPAAARVRHKRRHKAEATRSAILAAALDEFAARGFAAARLDDVARRAGVAKGTIYVHFHGKEALFEELVRSSLGPLIGALETAPAGEMPLRTLAERLIETFVRDIYGTRRRDVLRLVISEGERFPQLAHIYYREVIKRALAALRAAVRRAIDRGEIKSDALIRFPQLLVAPALVAMLWEPRFARFEPLDIAPLMRTHLDLMFAALEQTGP